MATKTLHQVFTDCISAAKLTSPLTVQKGNLYRWKGRVTSSITAELKFRCLPYYGLVIVDSSSSIPCIIVDPVAAASKLPSLCDQTIIIRDPQFSVEVVVTDSKQYDSVHVFLEPDNIKLPDPGPNITVAPSLIETTKVYGNDEVFTCNMVPCKISPAILTAKCEVLCLILATVIYHDEDRKDDVWLILRNEQVAWKDFLIPNRNYTVRFSSNASSDDFKKYKSFHAIADKYFDLPQRQMIHHKDLIKTMAVTFLPENTRISSDFTLFDEMSKEDWFSILDDRLYKLKFASVYGVIKDINYLESWNMKNCPWCDPSTDRPECDPTTETSNQDAPNYKWCSLIPKFVNKPGDTIHLPQLNADPPQNKVIGFGIRGGKINVQIIVQEVSTERLSYVFLKRWKMEQYPAGLSKGVTVCFTDVNVKRSRKNNLYFVNTPLTRILYLNVFNTLQDDSGSNWGPYRFPISKCTYEKVWGAIELEMLAKVSIATKCKLCNQTYVQKRCPNVFCTNHRRDINEASCEVSASARLFVRSIEPFAGSTLYLKNEHVRMYLDIPEEIWRKFCKYSALSELVYSHYFSELSSNNTDLMTMALYAYCKYYRSKNRFHICCKGFKGDTSEDRKYFCIDMKEIDPQRLAVSTAQLKQDDKQNQIESAVDGDN